MRKLVYGALALSAALTLSVGSVAAADVEPTPAETTAPAESAAPAGNTKEFASKVTVVSVAGDSLILDASEAKEVMVGTAKVSKGKTGNVMKVSSWDTYEVNQDESGMVVVDLSKIATTKDNYIRIKADSEADSDAVTIKLPAAPSKLKATYDKEKEAIVLTDNKAAVAKDVSLQWRTVNSDIHEVKTQEGGVIDDKSEDISLETYRMSGGVIYLRTAPTEDPDWSQGSDAEGIKEEDGTTPVYVVTGPVRSSKELKVTIAKRANAPKLSVNYVKGTIAIPAKAQYRILNTEGDLPQFADATTAKVTLELGTADVAGKTINASNPFAIDVMTAKNGKKPASKIGHTTFAAQTTTDAKEVAVADVVANTKAEKDGSYTATVSLTNNSKTEAYTLTYTPFGATKAKTVKIAAGKTTKATKVVTASAVTLQRVGNAKTKSWAGAAVKFNSIDDLKAGAGSVVGPDTPAAKEYTISLAPADGESLTDAIDTITVDGKNVTVSDVKVKAGATVEIVTQQNYTITFNGVSPSSTEEGSGKKVVTTYTFTMPSNDVSGTCE